MAKGHYLGEFEQLVLLALLRLGDKAYGMPVRQEIEERARRSTSIGAVYATLERMEEKGYISSHAGKPTEERGGRAKRYFRIESPGLRALRQSQASLERMMDGLSTQWGRS